MSVLLSALPSVRPSFRPSAWNNSAPTEWIFIKFNKWIFFENLSRKFKFHSTLTRITNTLSEDHLTLSITSRSVLPIIRNASDKFVEKIKTHILCSITFPENRTVFEIMWKNIVEPAGNGWQNGACALHVVYLRLQNTHSDYKTQLFYSDWLHERASLLRYTYIACLVSLEFLPVRNFPVSFFRWFHSCGFFGVSTYSLWDPMDTRCNFVEHGLID